MAESEIEPLPYQVRQRLKLGRNSHPGLALDKYVQSWSEHLPAGDWSKRVQEPTITQLALLSRKPPEGLDFEWLLQRRQQTIRACGNCREIGATTAGAMTLHLSRASALENAGICLHPIYGFVFLPGSSVKGMSRAWAETIWLKNFNGEAEQQAKQQIHAVFGNEPGEQNEDCLGAGSIVFHDGWPQEWPQLQSDILNNHHSAYYRSDNNNEPPGEWENPIPVYFLSAKQGVPFTFALSVRHSRVDLELLDLAEQFLVGALRFSGAGAKTNAGYGGFHITSSTQTEAAASAWAGAVANERRAEFTCNLQLVTPAFLAGSDQEDPAGCDLRSATLRGVLRAWWRTMHACWLDVRNLRRLEAALWGDTNAGGAIRLTVEAMPNNPEPVSFDRRTLIDENRLPQPPADENMAPGLTYHSFGMDDRRAGRHFRRHYKPAGCLWTVSFTARPACLQTDDNKPIRLESAKHILNEGVAALWLLVHFGGVGAKSRRGFGSLALQEVLPLDSLEAIRTQADRFRSEHQIPVQRRVADTPSIDEILPVVEISTPWKNQWLTIDRVAAAAQEFAQHSDNKYNREKRAMGLPRKIGRRGSGRMPYGNFRPGPHVTTRHSSPMFYSLSRDSSERYCVRIAAFPSSELPDLVTSRSFLTKAINEIQKNLHSQIGLHPDAGVAIRQTPATVTTSAEILPKQFAIVAAQLVESKEVKKKGVISLRWKAKLDQSDLIGPIINYAAVPSDTPLNSEIELIVDRCNGKEIAFLWQTPEELERIERILEKRKGRSDKKQSRRKY